MNTHSAAPLDRWERSRLAWEMGIVFALSLGASAVYSLVRIIERVTREEALSQQRAPIHEVLAPRPGFDLTFQLLGIMFGLAPVALVLWLTWKRERPRFTAVGLTSGSGRWWLKDAGAGFALAALIGIPGLVWYVAAKLMGINTTVVPAALDTYWWTVPVLVLHALQAALLEEIVVVGYLFGRLRLLGLRVLPIIVVSALIRGSYHLYQGFGGFLGNVVMGLVFGWVYQRFGRVLPLIIAHWVLDIVSFVGYPLAVASFPQWFA